MEGLGHPLLAMADQIPTPVSFEPTLQEATRLVIAGQPRQAEALLRGLLLQDIRRAAVYRLLAQAAHMQKRELEAVALADHAISIEPTEPAHHFMLGVARMGLSQWDAAAQAFQAALNINPDVPETHLNLGNVRKLQEDLPRAVEHYRAALRLRPNMPEAYLNLGAVLRTQTDYAGAEQAVRQALEIDPGLPGAWLNLGNALAEQGKFEDAAEAYGRHLEAAPGDVANWVALGANLATLGRREEALAAHDRAVALAPEDGLQKFERSVTKLLFGDFDGGWADYEHRWSKESLKAEKPKLPGREWRGEEIAGKTLFVFGEQGYGDNIQFARYLPLLVERGAKVVFCSEASLRGLFEPLTPSVRWYDGSEDLPPYDYFVALLSLPYHFGTRLETIPAEVPYLTPSAARRMDWADRIAALEPGPEMKVGLVWTGRPVHGNDRERSLSPEQLAPLLQVPGVRFFSLQKPPRPGHVDRLKRLGEIHDLAPQLEDFADTAAALENLDLLISVDTAVAHLAGALGRPTWVMIPRQPDWRWLAERSDSPWYPTLELFRQSSKGDWATVVHRIAGRLAVLSANFQAEK